MSEFGDPRSRDELNAATLGPTSQIPEPPTNWREILQQRKVERIADQEQRFRQSIVVALQSDPEFVAETQRLGLAVDVDPRQVEQNIEAYQQVARRLTLDRWHASRRDPILRLQMQDPSFARIAHDDIEELGAVEQAGLAWQQAVASAQFNELMRFQSDRGLTPAETARLGALKQYLMDTPRVPWGLLNTPAAILGPLVEIIAPRSLTTGLATGVTAGGVTLLTGPGAIAAPVAAKAGLLFGSAAEAFRQSYNIIGGQNYVDLLKAGVDPTVAAWTSRFVGLAGGLLELTGASIYGRAVGVTAPLLRKTFAQTMGRETAKALVKPTIGQAALRGAQAAATITGGETTTELLQEIAQVVGEETGRAIEGLPLQLSTTEGVKAIAERLAGVVAETALGMSVLSLPGAVGRFHIENARVQRAKADAERFTTLVDLVGRTKTLKRNPDALEGFTARVLDGGDATTAYINAAQFTDALEQSGVSHEALERVIPDVVKQLPEALAAGGDVVIPTARFTAHLAGTDLGTLLQPHIRFDPEGYSAAELPQVQQAQEELAKRTEALLQRNDEFAASARRVEQDVLAQLRTTQRISTEEARTAATIFRNWAAVTAETLGVMPHELAARFPFRIAGERQVLTETSLQQLLSQPRVPELQELSDDVLLQRIDEAYEQQAPQEELDRLETELAHRAVEIDDADLVSAVAPEMETTGLGIEELMRQTALRGRTEGLTPEEIGRDIRTSGDFAVLTQAEPRPEVSDADLGQEALDALQEHEERVGAMRSRLERAVQRQGALAQPISTRVPRAVSSTENPRLTPLTVDYEVALADKVVLAKHASVFREMPFLRLDENMTDEQIAEAYVQHVASNVDWLVGEMTSELRERTRLWYHTAQALANKWAKRYGVAPMQVTGVIAALSPGRDWHLNASMAERMLDIWFGQQDTVWTEEMSKRLRSRTKTKIPLPEGVELKNVRGKKLSDLEGQAAAFWLRVFDQAHNDPRLVIFAPEGVDSGRRGTIAWTSYDMMAKAISIMREGSFDNIFLQLGLAHKVRSFNNNMLDPADPRQDVTVDTHAVAASYLLPVAQKSVLTKQAWGEGAASSSITGQNGLYPYLAEAYRRAARKHELLAPEGQSIAWEQIRTLFTPKKKTAQRLGETIAIWNRYKAGDITIDQARDETVELFGGFGDPVWIDADPEGEVIESTYEGRSRDEVQARATSKELEPRILVEAKPNANPELLAQWDELTDEQRAAATAMVVTDVTRMLAEEYEVAADVTPIRGGWLDDVESSIAVSLTGPQNSVAFAGALGDLLYQEGMLVLSATPAQGLRKGWGLLLHLPAGYTGTQIDQLYQGTLRPLELHGAKPIEGHSTDGRFMVIGIDGEKFPDLDVKELARAVDVAVRAIDDTIDVQAHRVYSRFLTQDDYGTATTESPPAAGSPLETRRDDLRARVAGIYQNAIDRATGRLDVGGPERDGGRAAPTYGTPQRGSSSFLGIHFSQEPRESLDARRYGTGAPGSERRRVAGHPILSHRIYYYVDLGEGVTPELGVGPYQHATRLDNIYNVTEDPLGIRAANTDDVNKLELAIYEAGFDGYFVDHPQLGPAAVLIGPQHTAVPVARIEPQLAQEGLQARRGEFFPQQLTAVLHEGADFSTVVHEMSHYFFEVTERLLAQPDPPQLLLDDFNVFLEWTGVESFGAWQAMSFEQRRPHTEAFAFAFEVYLFEGRAPSTKMARLFDKIRRFMVRVYQDVVNVLNPLYREQHGRDLPALTPEMRGVFDRMLAAEQDVARADAVRSFVPLFESQEASGLSDQQWADYLVSLDEAREAAVTDVTQASLKQMQWLSRARGKVLQKLQRQHNKLRREVAAEVEQEVRARPVYRAIRYLRRGEIDLGADGGVATVTGVYQMNTARVRELLPPGAALTDMAGMTTQAGLDPDVVAELFGFESGRALVEALVEAAPLDQEVATQTDVRMLQEHGDLVDEAQIEQAVQEALHNEARARFVAVELNFLQRAQRPVSVMTAAAKQAARRILARKKMRDVRPSDFAAAEVRARRSAETAVKKGDPQAAITAKHQELLQHHLAKEALRVRRDLEKTQRFFRKFNRPDKKLATTRNVDYIGVGRAILAQHGLGPAATAAKPHLDLIEQYAPELLEDLRPLIEVGLNDTTHWRDMTLGDFEVLEDILRSLWFQSRRDRVIDIDGQKVERDSVVEGELLPALRAPEAKRRGRTLTPKERQRVDFGALLAWFTHVEAWAIARDGGTPGAIHRYLFSLLRDPVNAYETEKLELARELHRRLNKHDFGDRRATIYSEELDFEFRNKAELIGALRHAGTESNLRRLLLGHQMVEQPEEPGGPIDTSRWWQFIDKMITEGVNGIKLTKADFDLVQHIWDVYDTLLPRSQKAHFDVYGYRFEEVPKVPIRTPWGTYRGGYVPLKYDPHDSPEFFKDDPLLASSEEYRRSFPSTGRGFTFSRVTEFVAPLLLDVRMDAHTLDEHLRFIHLQRPGRDVLRLLRDPRVADALKRVDKNLVEEMFIPWVGSVLKNRIATPGGPRQLSQFLTVLRRRSGLATMFGNLPVGAQQLTGIGNALLYVKPSYLRGAAALYMRELFTGRLVADVEARSEFMSLRLGKGLGQIRDDIDVMLKPGWVGRAEQWSLEHGYFLQRWFQQPVDVITWKGRYDQSIAEGRTETQAVRDADAAVRRSQGSGQVADLSRLEKGHPLVRLMIQFSSFWIATANAVLQRPTARERVAAGAIAVMFAGLAAGLITQALRGGWEDEDDDGVLWDDVTSWAFGETLQATAGIVAPSLGPNLLNPITGEFGGRITLGAGFGSLERGLAAPIRTLLNATDDKREVSGRDVKDLGMLLSLILGIPVTPVTDRLKFLLDEEERAEAIRGAVVGR